ncbi:MAG: hypothetical protein K6C40_12930 [Thermoguttaceae bacterium]|nr:hypothetical protein [Thermoguttaceae bacterium]
MFFFDDDVSGPNDPEYQLQKEKGGGAGTGQQINASFGRYFAPEKVEAWLKAASPEEIEAAKKTSTIPASLQEDVAAANETNSAPTKDNKPPSKGI